MKSELDSGLTENVVVRVSPKEKALLEKYAKKEGASLSGYVRGTMLADMAIMHGDTEAMKIIFTLAKEKLWLKFDRKFSPFREKESAR
jgi:hypothetical protein